MSVLASSTSKELIDEGDSLFQKGNYTEAFSVYDQLLKANYYSPQMLLKMAYVKEALGDYTNTLYYLNLYYMYSADNRALTKMEELASAYDLKGYKLNDGERFLSFYYKSFKEINIGAIIVFLVILGFLIKNKIRKHNYLLPAFSLLILMGFFFFLNNFAVNGNKGIVSNDETFLMDAPSAGARVVEKIKKGHRLKVIDEKDIWYKVAWDEEEAFVRKHNMKIVH
ncbi:SH3 domain-containing protein [Flammeovirgaceae bacterium SG7u.111]|nr:SH3 domain-containing protein [Flammeovirgaceae bacterium SG7u.132]WPO36866.1 SH3 domain-containing protein [Flammeovirgaceae bacterium SG7u.111]